MSSRNDRHAHRVIRGKVVLAQPYNDVPGSPGPPISSFEGHIELPHHDWVLTWYDTGNGKHKLRMLSRKAVSRIVEL